jgi:hypothetical protein
MSLLPINKRYTRPQPELTLPSTPPNTLLNVLEAEESHLAKQLQEIEEAKNREQNLRNRLNIVQQSLQAFRALEAKPESVQEVEGKVQLPVTQERRIRKAAKVRETPPKKLGEPIGGGIANDEHVKYDENIELVHDDFSTFPAK